MRILRLFGRRKWFPLFFLLVISSVLILLLLWKSYGATATAPQSSKKHRKKEKGSCVECLNPDPLPMTTLDSNLLLILIHSAVKRRDRRNAIRATWLSDYQQASRSSPVHYSFVLGGADLPTNLSGQLQQESAHYNDMTVLPTNPDTALDLTQRTIESFQMASETFDFLYVLKCDEDSYVDVPRLASELQKRNREVPLYWGELLTWSIYTKGLYGEKHFTVCNRYLPYALGGGYVLSRDLVEVLVANAPHLHRYVSEDVSVGAWLAPYNIERVHDTRFNTGAASRGCKDPYLVTHKVSVEHMYSYYEVYRVDRRFCSERNRDKGTAGHRYRWTALPSKSIEYSELLP